MAFDFKGLIEPLARHFLGEPNKARSTKTELRFGNNGSVAVVPEKDYWFNHEGGFGGGVVEFVQWQARTDPIEWLKEHHPDRFDQPRPNTARPNGPDRGGPLGPLVATFNYCDEAGTVLFHVLKFDPPKDFRQKAPDGSWSVRGIRQVPYRLPELIRAIADRQLIFVPEGEKDVERLRSEGCNATTNAMGAGKWRNELSHYFKGAIDVVVIADNDPQAKNADGELLWHPDGRPKLPGQDHAHQVCASLKPIVSKVRLLDLGKHWADCPSKGDISDWFDKGKTLAELFEIIATLPDWQPEKSSLGGATVKPMGSPVAPGSAAPGISVALSDDDLAEQFKAAKGDDFAYLPIAKQWRRWDGSRWIDCTNVNLEASLGLWLRQEIKPNLKKLKDKMRIGAQQTISAITSRLRALLLIDDRAFDRDPWLFNTPGGTVNLKSEGGMTDFRPRPHDRADHITKIAAATPGGDGCPLWTTFIEFVCNGDQDLGGYLQKLAGYALAGISDEQMFAFLYGSGNNGKSKFLEALLHVMGDYGVTVNAEVFLWSAIPRHSEELMPIRGARLVFASEVPKDARWNEGRLKNITGGEKTRARGMHSNSVEFDIEATLIIAGNDRPHMKGVDVGIARRLHLVPFTAVVGEEMRDKRLGDKLKAEAPGILRWCLEGCRLWQSEGLERPAAVQAATDRYIEDEDSMRQWLDECTLTDIVAKTNTSALYQSWKKWADASGIKPGNINSLSARLVALGFDRDRDHKGSFFKRIAIRQPDELWPEQR